MTIALAADHAGFATKLAVRNHLESRGHRLLDFGTDGTDPVDYPEVIRPAARAVANGQADLAVILGGSGNGEAMVANKVRGIRCALCWNEESARLAREHNDANVISIGARMVSQPEAIRIVDAWLTAEFQDGRHLRRIRKIEPEEGTSP